VPANFIGGGWFVNPSAALSRYEQTRAVDAAPQYLSSQSVQSVSQRPPSCPQQHSEDGMTDPSVSTPRTKQDYATDLKDSVAIKKQVKLALVSDTKHLRCPNKQIARHAQCSPRTVEAWMEERSLPGLECFLRLVPHSPSLQKMLLHLMSFDPDTDPRYMQAFVEFQSALRRAGL
jgi:hypothetical protein